MLKPVSLYRDHVLIVLQLPPHIHTVYRSTDATQRELVAKHVDEQSTEIEILEYLHTIRPRSSLIITLLDTVPANTGRWAIFPKMHSVYIYLSMCSGEQQLRRGRLSQLGCDLIDGLAFLHEHGVAHLDVKLGNLVYTDDFRLRIIDFDSAVRVESENDMVEGGDYYGTPGWRAPEIHDRSAFSPIRADRWSCGKVLLCFVENGGMVNLNTELERFAEQLVDDNPLHRPSLNDWSRCFPVTMTRMTRR
jgi:serine/threonine protein kinase